jgi:hypothetical protein
VTKGEEELSELQLNLDGTVRPAAADLLEAPATTLLDKRDLHVVDERVFEETEDVEHRRFARTVGADKDAHARYVDYFHVPECLEVL